MKILIVGLGYKQHKLLTVQKFAEFFHTLTKNVQLGCLNLETVGIT